MPRPLKVLEVIAAVAYKGYNYVTVGLTLTASLVLRLIGLLHLCQLAAAKSIHDV